MSKPKLEVGKSENGKSTTTAVATKPSVKDAAKDSQKESKKEVVTPKPKVVIKPVPPTQEEIEMMVKVTREKSERRNEIIKHLDRFHSTKNDLREVAKQQGSDFDPDVDSDDLRLTFESSGKKDVHISNNLLCRTLIDELVKTIDAKIKSLNDELLSV